MFQTVPLSIITNFSLYTQQWYMSYRFADSCKQLSWWWTEELSETCRVSFQKKIWELGASSWFYRMKFIQYNLKKLCMLFTKSQKCNINMLLNRLQIPWI